MILGKCCKNLRKKKEKYVWKIKIDEKEEGKRKQTEERENKQ